MLLQWSNQYDGLRHFNRNDYNWCYVNTINRINERLRAEMLANPLPKKPPAPTRRSPMAHAPLHTPDGEIITMCDLTDIPADLAEEMRPDYDLTKWLDRMEKEAVERMCEDMDSLETGYCKKVTAVRQSSITTLKKKYVQNDATVIDHCLYVHTSTSRAQHAQPYICTSCQTYIMPHTYTHNMRHTC